MAQGQRGPGMEGWVARWYEKSTKKYDPEFRELADQVAGSVRDGGAVLEVAPGPGYLAVELAKRGLDVTGLDISKTFVERGRERASSAGVDVQFVQGDAAHMPFGNGSFDFLVCRAAFKNFSDPEGALREMWRVLRPGADGLIIDLRRDAQMSDIVASLYSRHSASLFEQLSGRMIFSTLRKRAYTAAEIEMMLSRVPFARASVERDPIGMSVHLHR
jgi:ubiquinone/menaquinone biosynthesis C-methylase UbiE